MCSENTLRAKSFIMKAIATRLKVQPWNEQKEKSDRGICFSPLLSRVTKRFSINIYFCEKSF